jgi:hypothetical protein
MTTRYTDVPEWANYYKNLTEDDFPTDEFEKYCFYTNTKSFDLYFWGIKKASGGGVSPEPDDDYTDGENIIKGKSS